MFVVFALALANAFSQSTDNKQEQKKKTTDQDKPTAKACLYISAPPDAKQIKDEIATKVQQSELVEIVFLESRADLILEVVQSGKLNAMTGSGNKGAAVLKVKSTGEEVWNDSHGGGWSWRGWSNKAVGRKLGDELVKFLRSRPSITKVER
jgi:hypothetical protein